MESLLAAIPWGYKQPKTRPRVGTKNPVRSKDTRTDLESGTRIGGRSLLREGQFEGEGVALLAPGQPRIVEARSPIEPAKFDIEVLLPEKK